MEKNRPLAQQGLSEFLSLEGSRFRVLSLHSHVTPTNSNGVPVHP